MTESPGLDNLHYPTGCIRDTEARAERLFGSARTFFLVNGATSGVQASLLAVRMTLGPGTVVLPRNVHKSLVSAMGMSGLEPVFVWPEYEPRLGGYLPLDWPRVTEILTDLENRGEPAPKAVFVINPTYTGFARDLSGMAAGVHARGMALVVDEAHGTHFAVGKGLPPTVLRTGADLVTHGAHKTTVAYTQTAFLHVGPSAPERFPGLLAAAEEALRFVTSTSPSYILMASLEQAVQVLERDGGAWVDRGTRAATELALRLSRIPGLSVACYNNGGLPAGLMHDPSKVLINLGGLGVTGPDAAKFLVRKRGVVPEMAGPKYILLLVSGAHGPGDVDDVESAFRELAERYPRLQSAEPQAADNGANGDTAALQREVPHPTRVMTLREAFLSVARPVPVEEAAGRISADTVVIYPPGSPLITPGERIDRDVVEYILRARKAGLNVLGRGIRSDEGEMMVYCVASS
jgi:arginine/lysine/ornithine decarboxylase